MKNYIKLIRVHHYIKNLLIFAALTCSGQVFVKDKFISGMLGFISFCAMSSAIYVVNDILDKEKDKKHPVKCNRPIASGAISSEMGLLVISVLFVISIIANGAVFHTISSLLLFLYFSLNLLYSYRLKNIPLVDVSILVAGFVIRIVYGAVITDIEVSNWLYLTTIAIAFYFALGKRRNELRHIENGETRKVLKYYSESFLDKNMYMCLTLANVFYALWSMDSKTMSSYGGRNLIFTVPIVLIITMKYSLNIESESDGDPVEVLLHDKYLLTLCVLYVCSMLIILYM